MEKIIEKNQICFLNRKYKYNKAQSDSIKILAGEKLKIKNPKRDPAKTKANRDRGILPA